MNSEKSAAHYIREKTQESVTEKGSAFGRYLSVIVGSQSILFFIYYEFCLFIGLFPGAVGLFFRKIFWPSLFLSCGRGVLFDKNIIVRHPKKIKIGNRVVISEGCILDARNNQISEVITIGSDVIFSNNVMLSSKGGKIGIGNNVGIGAQTIIQSIDNCPVKIGSEVIIGPQCYIVGGSSYNTDRTDIPINHQGIKYDGGLEIEDDVWLGAKVTVLGGVKIGAHSIAAAGAVVNKSIPEFSVCGGVPAKIIKNRRE